MFYSHSYGSPANPPSPSEYKGKLGLESWFFIHDSQHFFFSFHFFLHTCSQAIKAWGWQCLKSSRTSRSLRSVKGNMGALMVIFSLQTKQRRKRTGRPGAKGDRQFYLVRLTWANNWSNYFKKKCAAKYRRGRYPILSLSLCYIRAEKIDEQIHRDMFFLCV